MAGYNRSVPKEDRLKPLSLAPLPLKDALRAAMQTPPPDDEPKERAKGAKKPPPKRKKGKGKG